MKRILLATICAIVITSTAALADEASRKEAVLKLLEVTNTRATIDQLRNSVEAMMKKQFEGQLADLPSEQREALESVQKKEMRWISETISWSQMKDMYVDIYTRVFTKDEIAGLLQFYQSSIGQKLLTKMPELIQTTMQISQEYVKKRLPESEERLKRAMTDLEAKYKRVPSKKGLPESVGQDTSKQKLPATKDAKWNTLVGTWFGTLEMRGGGRYMWIGENKNDGTYKIRFQTIDGSGNRKEQTEIGEWGVSGDVQFTILKTVIKGGKTITVNPTKSSFRDAYRILELNNEVFVYKSLDTGDRFSAKRVASEFSFPD